MIDLDNKFKDKVVLVTGGAGFIGSHLVERLVALGANVFVVDNLRDGKLSNLSSVATSIQFRQGDIRDADFISSVLREAEPVYVFHLAANASVPYSVENPEYDFDVNCNGLEIVLNNVLSCCPDAKCIFSSSGAVYGNPEVFPIVEGAEISSISPYGKSKVAAEQLALNLYKKKNLNVVIGRLFNTYGPRMPRFVVFDFLCKLKADASCLKILGNGKQVRDFNYVSDTVEGLLLLAIVGKTGAVYNVASGNSYSVTELANMLFDTLNLSPYPQIEYTGKSWEGDAICWKVAIDKIKTLGYLPKISLESGLKNVVAWFEDISLLDTERIAI